MNSLLLPISFLGALGIADVLLAGHLELGPLYVVTAYLMARRDDMRWAAGAALLVTCVLLICRLPRAATIQWLGDQSLAISVIWLAAITARTVARQWPLEEEAEAPELDAVSTKTTQFVAAPSPPNNFLDAHRLEEVNERALPVEELVGQLHEAPIVDPEFVRGIAHQGSNLQTADMVTAYLIRKKLLTPYQGRLLRTGNGCQLSLGNYWIRNRIFAGGGAIVLQARHKQLGLVYAIKVMDAGPEDSDRIRRSLLEMKASADLLHPNIVVVRETGEEQGIYYIVMEWIAGHTLQTMVQTDGPLSLEESVDYGLQAARGLAFAHSRGFTHRDVKPGNLMIDSRGAVKVLDMGLVGNGADTDDAKPAPTGLFGTIDYMAPEQAQSFSAADQRSDVFSFGATLFFLLSGRVLLRGRTNRERLLSLLRGRRRSVRKHLNNVPTEVVDLIEAMTQSRPARRIQTMHEVVDRLEHIAGDCEIDTRRFANIRLLIVEDSPTQQRVLRGMLANSNSPFDVTCAGCIEEALGQLRRKAYDAALVDLTLPDSAGVESVASIRAVTPTLPIVVLTGSDDNNQGVQCIRAGANDFYSKSQLSRAGLERRILLSLSRGDVVS